MTTRRVLNRFGYLAQTFLIALLAVSEMACSRPNVTVSSVGDGQLTEKSWPAYHPRYSVELPAVTLNGTSSASLSLDGLPHADYTLYLSILDDGSQIVGWQEWESVKHDLSFAELKVMVEILEGGTPIMKTPDVMLAEWSPGEYGGSIVLYRTDVSEIPMSGSVEVHLKVAGATFDPVAGLGVQVVLEGGGFKT